MKYLLGFCDRRGRSIYSLDTSSRDPYGKEGDRSDISLDVIRLLEGTINADPSSAYSTVGSDSSWSVHQITENAQPVLQGHEACWGAFETGILFFPEPTSKTLNFLEPPVFVTVRVCDKLWCENCCSS